MHKIQGGILYFLLYNGEMLFAFVEWKNYEFKFTPNTGIIRFVKKMTVKNPLFPDVETEADMYDFDWQ